MTFYNSRNRFLIGCTRSIVNFLDIRFWEPASVSAYFSSQPSGLSVLINWYLNYVYRLQLYQSNSIQSTLTITISPGWNEISSELRAKNSYTARYFTKPAGATMSSSIGCCAGVCGVISSAAVVVDQELAVSHAEVNDSFLRLFLISRTC